MALFSFGFSNPFFYHDPIENNQYLLNDINSNILDTISYSSILFDQSHEIPYGAFPFKDIKYLSALDTAGTISQFIFKKGDYRFRDLLLSFSSLKESHLEFRYIGNIKSFTPLYIPLSNESVHQKKSGSISGDTFLQNHMISINKETPIQIFESSILYHDENPYVPISYKSHSSDSTIFNTRKSKSIIWGFSNEQIFNSNLNFKLNSKNMYSNINKYSTVVEQGLASIYNQNTYFTGINSLQVNYHKRSFFFSSIVSSSTYDMLQEDLTMEETEKFSLLKKTAGLTGGLNGNGNEIDLNFFLEKVSFNFENQVHEYLNLKPSFKFKIKFNDNINLRLKYSKKDGLIDTFIDDNLVRGLILYDNLEFSLFKKIKKLDAQIGMGSVSNITTQNYLESKVQLDRYKYFDFYLSYLSDFFDFYLDSRTFIVSEIDNKYSPWINNYLNYQIKIKYPPKNKPYTAFISMEGNHIKYKDGGVYVNDLPIFHLSEGNVATIQHFMNFQIGLEFKNFMLSYNNISNNGNDFSVDSNHSDVGSAFLLPDYNFFEDNISIFHYLRISWTFLE